MKAMIQFLGDEKGFSLYDFSASNWAKIDSIGESWLLYDQGQLREEDFLALKKWDSILPSLDIWLDVGPDELQFIPTFIPTLEWTGEPLGLKILLDPESGQKKLETLATDYISARRSVEKVRGASSGLKLWPESLSDYLKGMDNKGLVDKYFSLSVYILDPAKQTRDDEQEETEPDHSYFRSQVSLSPSDLKKLFQVDYIEAQRGFTDANQGSLLTDQFRTYYEKHLNIKESPDAGDIDVLKALQEIETVYGKQLIVGFEKPLDELGTLGYPGFHNPKPMLNVKLSSFEGLNHNAAVEHSLCDDSSIRLPEFSNGLGYQNLISMTFAMMSFRDSWMRVGKRSLSASIKDTPLPRLHLVLIEEPEAHLHAQVQRVFVERAYTTLRNHDRLRESTAFTTQLAISTHSSCIVMGADFCNLRYFRRVMADSSQKIPFSSVVNMNDTFLSTQKKDKKKTEKEKEPGIDTRRFATRYIRSTHCDLFFADAIILIEGSAERMLLPFFIKNEFPNLDSSYLSILEIGGSHAHRIRPLIEKLGIPCLIITDLDSANGEGNHVAERPKRGAGQITANSTLKQWFKKDPSTEEDNKTSIDELLDAYDTDVLVSKLSCPIRIAYQGPVKVSIKDDVNTKYLPYTFEDALIVNNLEAFEKSFSESLLDKVHNAIKISVSVEDFSKNLYDLIRGPELSGGNRGKGIEKAAFVLDLIESDIFQSLKAPSYIAEGLVWLEEIIKNENVSRLSPSTQENVEQKGSVGQ
jgi:predicted ATP-dependent endonuclease of OLD family